MKAQEGNRGIALYSSCNLGARWGRVVNAKTEKNVGMIMMDLMEVAMKWMELA
jgi:hypothetical protein